MHIDLDTKIKDFLDFCNSNNIDIYLVGGFIRDHLENIKSFDYDFALVSDYEQCVKLLKEKYKIKCDNKYKSIKFNLDEYNIEISKARKEREYLDYRHPNIIEFSDDIKEDSKRRDFTINALYYKNDKIYDFYNGLEDIKNHTLRVIGDTLTRFKEDPLRILRMIRFSCMNFDISNDDKKIILDNQYLLKELSEASFNKEFDRLLMMNNLYVLYEYKELFENYFEIKIYDLSILNRLTTLEEKKTYLGIKNKSSIYKYKDLKISNSVIELSKLIYKYGKDIIYNLVNYYDKVNETNIMDTYTYIITNCFYDKTQLALSSKDIIEITHKQELTSYYIDTLAYAIISGNIRNKKEEIIKYIKETLK